MVDSKTLKTLKKNDSKSKDELDIDLDAVQNIVSKMKKKSSLDGTGSAMSEGHLKELRDIISEGKLSKLDIDAETKILGHSSSDLEKSTVKLYKPLKGLIDKIVLIILKNKR